MPVGALGVTVARLPAAEAGTCCLVDFSFSDVTRAGSGVTVAFAFAFAFAVSALGLCVGKCLEES